MPASGMGVAMVSPPPAAGKPARRNVGLPAMPRTSQRRGCPASSGKGIRWAEKQVD